MGAVLQSQSPRQPAESEKDLAPWETSPNHPPTPASHTLVERSAIPIAVLVSLIAFYRYAAYGSRRLWFDEIYTFTVALQPKWVDVWNAFRRAVDLQPPLFSFLTRISWMLFGRNELALRMPEILGTILFSWCIFFYIRKRLGSGLGLAAMVLSLVTDLEFFSADARPYGLVMGACGLAMLAWRNAVDNPRLRLARPLFAASLALMVATHAYAVTIVAMFAIAELFRYTRTRRPDWSLWVGFLVPSLPMTLYWFPYHTVKAIKGGGVSNGTKIATWNAVPGFYLYFFNDRILMLLLLGVLLVGFILLRTGRKPRTEGMPAHEIALAAALALSPFFCVALAMLVTNYYLYRYSVYAIGGLVILATLLIDAVAPSRRAASAALLTVALLLFGMDPLRIDFSRESMKKKDLEMEVPFAAIPKDAPLVIASGMTLLPADMYSSAADLARTYYLLDPELSIKYTGSTTFNFGPPFTDFYHFRTHLEPYRSFVREHKKFWVYGPYAYMDDWQVQKLKDDGARIVEKGRYAGLVADNFLLEVELP
jgi:hypothetical protein